VVLDHSTVIFQRGKKGGGGTYKKSRVCKTPIVKIDRNKYLTLNRVKRTEQIRSNSFITIYCGMVTSEG
jgi:cellulose synthase/poly-beta-1,6-N-acetylglucosamine synthase-like glycosyltransferase